MSTKQKLFRRRSFAKTPIGVINSCQSSLAPQTLETVSYEDHKKALLKNNGLARELNSCKQVIHALKQEVLSLKANQIHSYDYYQAFERNSVLLFQLNDQFNGLKAKHEDFGESLCVCEQALAGGLNQLYYQFPDVVEKIGRNRQNMNEIPISLPSTSRETIGIKTNRYSLSSQERESRRSLSLEKIKNDFRVFSELSTIMEKSEEITQSSVNLNRESFSRNSVQCDGKTSVILSQNQSSLSIHPPIAQTIAEVNSDEENETLIEDISVKVSKKSDSSRSKSQIISKTTTNSSYNIRHTRSQTGKNCAVKSSNVCDEKANEYMSLKERHPYSREFESLQNWSSRIQSCDSETGFVVSVKKQHKNAKKTENHNKVKKVAKKRNHSSNDSEAEDSKGRKAVKSNETQNDLVRRLSVYDFVEEGNQTQSEPIVLKASKAKVLKVKLKSFF